jgi:acyl carrier protein
VNNPLNQEISNFVVSSWLGGDERGLEPNTDLQEAGVLDSFSMLSLVGFLESTYQVRFEPSDINPETFRTVETIAACVRSKQCAKV